MLFVVNMTAFLKYCGYSFITSQVYLDSYCSEKCSHEKTCIHCAFNVIKWLLYIRGAVGIIGFHVFHRVAGIRSDINDFLFINPCELPQ